MPADESFRPTAASPEITEGPPDRVPSPPPPPDPLACALDAEQPGGRPNKVERTYADRPEVLESIVRARRDRRLSVRQIADTLSKNDPLHNFSEGAVRSFLIKRGVYDA